MMPTDGAHTTFPMLGMEVPEFAHDAAHKRDFLLVVDEALSKECTEPRQMAWLVDITNEGKPQFIPNFMAPEASGHFSTTAATPPSWTAPTQACTPAPLGRSAPPSRPALGFSRARRPRGTPRRTWASRSA